MKNSKSSSIIFLFACLTLFTVLKTTSCELNQNNNEIILVDANEDKNEGSIYTKTDEAFQVSDEEFVATNEWQPLKENQAIPKGLHVRINLATGQREAKLLDNTENVETKNDREQIMSKELEDALKKLNDEKNLEKTDPLHV
jgi:hypothetical protein